VSWKPETNHKENRQGPDPVSQNLVDPVGSGQCSRMLAMLENLTSDACCFLIQGMRFFIGFRLEIEW